MKIKNDGAEQQIIELIQGSEMEQGSSMIHTQKQDVKLHTVFFDEPIGEPKKYRDIIRLLFQADQNDQFIFMINSPGGYLTTALAIIEGIKSSEANVQAVLIGECHSAASILALNCHNIVVTDAAHVLVHSASFGTGGTIINVQKHADFSTKSISRIIEETYLGFLTDVELKELKNGVEFWFDSKEIGKRLETRMKYLTEKHTKKSPKAKKVITVD